ncbi:MAG: ribonuclease HI family protein [Patescibacteria group bacterium]
MTKLIIYTDGASRGNPGHSSYGFTISDEKGKLTFEEGKYIGVTTNNVAEYTAVLEALRWIKENIKGRVRIELYVDSKLVAEQLSGRYKIKAKHLKPIIEKIQFLSLELGGIMFSHVPRSKNTLADRLANLALDSR